MQNVPANDRIDQGWSCVNLHRTPIRWDHVLLVCSGALGVAIQLCAGSWLRAQHMLCVKHDVCMLFFLGDVHNKVCDDCLFVWWASMRVQQHIVDGAAGWQFCSCCYWVWRTLPAQRAIARSPARKHPTAPSIAAKRLEQRAAQSRRRPGGSAQHGRTF